MKGLAARPAPRRDRESMEPAARDLERQILELAASVLNVRAGAISATLPLSWYGLDSVAAAELTWVL